MQHDLFEVVDELARLEQWHDDAYDLVVGAIEHQPVNSIAPIVFSFVNAGNR